MSRLLYERVVCCTNESFVVRTSRLLYEWVVCYTNESFVVRMSRLLYEWVVCCTIESFVVRMSRLLYEWVVCCTNESFVVRTSRLLYEWCLLCEWVICCTNESFVYEWVVCCTNESFVYEWVVCCTNESFVVRMSCLLCEWVVCCTNGSFVVSIYYILFLFFYPSIQVAKQSEIRSLSRHLLLDVIDALADDWSHPDANVTQDSSQRQSRNFPGWTYVEISRNTQEEELIGWLRDYTAFVRIYCDTRADLVGHEN